jgi:hypothetical protein
MSRGGLPSLLLLLLLPLLAWSAWLTVSSDFGKGLYSLLGLLVDIKYVNPRKTMTARRVSVRCCRRAMAPFLCCRRFRVDSPLNPQNHRLVMKECKCAGRDAPGGYQQTKEKTGKE